MKACPRTGFLRYADKNGAHSGKRLRQRRVQTKLTVAFCIYCRGWHVVRDLQTADSVGTVKPDDVTGSSTV